MKKRVKKIMAALLISVMVCGMMITSHAATCVHDTYSVYTYTSTTGQTTHQYVKETRHNPDGTVTYIYGLCTITGCIDHYNYVCRKCGAVTGTTQSGVYSRHSVSH